MNIYDLAIHVEEIQDGGGYRYLATSSDLSGLLLAGDTPEEVSSCYPTRFGAGSHELWRNPATKMQTPIPCHRANDIGAGLLARILR